MIEKIFAYQNTDAKLREIEQELLANEDRKKAKAAQKFLEGVEEAIAKLDARAQELSAMYEATVQKEAQLKEQEQDFIVAIEGLEDENQASYLLRKIDELLYQIKTLGEDAGKIAAEIQNVLNEYKTIKAKTKAAQVQFAESGAKYNEVRSQKQPDMEKIKKELAIMAKDIDPELMEKYNKKRKEKIFPIVVELQAESVCGGCYTEVFGLDLSRLQRGEIVEHICGRLLYRKQG